MTRPFRYALLLTPCFAVADWFGIAEPRAIAWSICVLQMLLALGLCAVVVRLGTRLAGPRAGWIAGFVAGSLDGGIVGVKADLTWRWFEAYTEGEFGMPGDGEQHYLYNWSEFSVWATDWMRAGAAIQRTGKFRRFRSSRDIEPGVLVVVAGSRIEGTFYYFNPGSDEQYFVASLGVNFGGG